MDNIKAKAFMDNDDFCIVINNPTEDIKNKLKEILNYELIDELNAKPMVDNDPERFNKKVIEYVDIINYNLNVMNKEVHDTFKKLSQLLKDENFYVDPDIEERYKICAFNYIKALFKNQNGKKYYDRLKEQNKIDTFLDLFNHFLPNNILEELNINEKSNLEKDLSDSKKENLIIKSIDYYSMLAQKDNN